VPDVVQALAALGALGRVSSVSTSLERAPDLGCCGDPLLREEEVSPARSSYQGMARAPRRQVAPT
jgi:hypothetical protein